MCFDKVLDEPNKKDSLESAKYDIKIFSIYLYILKKTEHSASFYGNAADTAVEGWLLLIYPWIPSAAPGNVHP